MATDPPIGGDSGIVVGGDFDRITVSVRVSADDLVPEDVSAAFGVEPSFAARKGDQRGSREHLVIQRTGVWYVSFEGSPEEWTIEDAIGALLDRLPADLQIWDGLAARYKLDVFCGLQMNDWNRGLSLPPELLKRLADRRLALDLDVYYSGADDPAI